MCVLSLAAAALRFYSVAAPVIRRPPQQIRKASIFARRWSTVQEVRTEQIESDTDTLKNPDNFRRKHSMLMPDPILLNLINNTSIYAAPGLKSTGQRFLETGVVQDSVITAKSCSLTSLAVWPCCSLKHSQWVLTDGGAQRNERSRSGMHTQPLGSQG